MLAKLIEDLVHILFVEVVFRHPRLVFRPRWRWHGTQARMGGIASMMPALYLDRSQELVGLIDNWLEIDPHLASPPLRRSSVAAFAASPLALMDSMSPTVVTPGTVKLEGTSTTP